MRHALLSQKLLVGLYILSMTVSALPLGALTQSNTPPRREASFKWTTNILTRDGFFGSRLGTTVPPSIHYNGAEWKITRGLGSVRGGGAMMERKFGTGGRLGSTPKWGKL